MAGTKKKETKIEHVQVKMVPSTDSQSERIYANFVSVNHTPYDFTLTFCDAQPPHNEEERKAMISEKVLKAAVQVEIAIPTALIEPLMRALGENLERFKKTYGKDKA